MLHAPVVDWQVESVAALHNQPFQIVQAADRLSCRVQLPESLVATLKHISDVFQHFQLWWQPKRQLAANATKRLELLR
jgi:hypothetical protein